MLTLYEILGFNWNAIRVFLLMNWKEAPVFFHLCQIGYCQGFLNAIFIKDALMFVCSLCAYGYRFKVIWEISVDLLQSNLTGTKRASNRLFGNWKKKPTWDAREFPSLRALIPSFLSLYIKHPYSIQPTEFIPIKKLKGIL